MKTADPFDKLRAIKGCRTVAAWELRFCKWLCNIKEDEALLELLQANVVVARLIGTLQISSMVAPN